MIDKPTPIRNRRVKSLSFYRQPDTEFVTPRLNKERGFIQAVGFTARGDYDCECYEGRRQEETMILLWFFAGILVGFTIAAAYTTI